MTLNKILLSFGYLGTNPNATILSGFTLCFVLGDSSRSLSKVHFSLKFIVHQSSSKFIVHYLPLLYSVLLSENTNLFLHSLIDGHLDLAFGERD